MARKHYKRYKKKSRKYRNKRYFKKLARKAVKGEIKFAELQTVTSTA